jgi:hypothetical protein
MATIIELGDGGFIAGDPVPVPGFRACAWCAGAGLEDDWDFDGYPTLQVCRGCWGDGLGERAHPLVPVRLRP